MREGAYGVKSWKLSPISRQLFRSRSGCYACIFPSRERGGEKRCQSAFYQCHTPKKPQKKNQKKTASSLTACVCRRCSSARCRLLLASEPLLLDVSASSSSEINVGKVCFLPLRRRSLHSQSSTFSPRTVGGQTDWGGWCLAREALSLFLSLSLPLALFPFFPLFPRLSTPFTHPQLKIKHQ